MQRPQSALRSAMAPKTSGGGRPMTSTRSAGFTRDSSRPKETNSPTFIQLPQEPSRTQPPEVIAQQHEAQVLAESDRAEMLLSQGQITEAVRVANAAYSAQKAFTAFREQHLPDAPAGTDLESTCTIVLAEALAADGQFEQAEHVLAPLAKERTGGLAADIRCMQGELCLQRGDNEQAAKYFRMALDRISRTAPFTRLRIANALGEALLRAGQWNAAIDALSSELASLDDKADVVPHAQMRLLFNLVVCNYALGDKNAMRDTFLLMVKTDAERGGEMATTDRNLTSSTKPQLDQSISLTASQILQPFYERQTQQNDERTVDSLSRLIDQRRKERANRILTAIRLIAPFIADTPAGGFDLALQTLRDNDHSMLATELELTKAVSFAKDRDFAQALQLFQRLDDDSRHLPRNCELMLRVDLSFLALLRGDIPVASRNAKLALQVDAFSSAALVTAGNVEMAQNEPRKAREHYAQAVAASSECQEALYNLGLANKKIGLYGDAISCFNQLLQRVPNQPAVLWSLADCYLKMSPPDVSSAQRYLGMLVTNADGDTSSLVRLGELAPEESKQIHYRTEAFRVNAGALDNVVWLGNYYTKTQQLDRAAGYYRFAVDSEPWVPKWRLLLAQCLRRAGHASAALEVLENAVRTFPSEVDPLKMLVALCRDLGRKEQTLAYAQKLKALLQSSPAKSPGSDTVSSPDDGETQLSPKPSSGMSSPQPSQSFTRGDFNESAAAPNVVTRKTRGDLFAASDGDDLLPL